MPESTTDQVIHSHSLTEMAEILVKHHAFHEGFYEIAVELTIGVGSVGSSEGSQMPGAIVGVKSLGLRRTETATHLAVDAALVNPLAPKRRPK